MAVSVCGPCPAGLPEMWTAARSCGFSAVGRICSRGSAVTARVDFDDQPKLLVA